LVTFELIYLSTFMNNIFSSLGMWPQWSLVSVPRDLLLITGKALTHATTGLCPVASYRASPDYFLSPNGGGRYQIIFLTKVLYLWWLIRFPRNLFRYFLELCDCRTSLAYRLMPQGNAILDCSPIAAAGHVIPQSYVRISVSQFMDDLAAEELIGSRDVSYLSLLLITMIIHPARPLIRIKILQFVMDYSYQRLVWEAYNQVVN